MTCSSNGLLPTDKSSRLISYAFYIINLYYYRYFMPLFANLFITNKYNCIHIFVSSKG